MGFDYVEIDRFTPQNAVTVKRAIGAELALLFEFPHSGNQYPKDFRPNPAVPNELIASGADSYMDQLFEGYEALGVTGVTANFPRVYLDCNRHQHDLTPDVASDTWYARRQPTTTAGTGLLWTVAQTPHKMYDREITDEEIRDRLTNCFVPYHQALTLEIERLRRAHGRVYLLACHSMRAVGRGKDGSSGVKRPEIDLGHRDYQTCDRDYVECVADVFSDLGYDVRHGEQYAGGETVMRYGWPGMDQHALQIEVRRDFYMNEETRDKNERFSETQAHCQKVGQAVAEFVRGKMGVSQAA